MRRTGDFDIYGSVGGTSQYNADIDSLVYGRFHSTATENYMKVNDPDLDKLLESTRKETDPAKRQDLFKQTAMRILDRMWGVDTIYVPRWDVWHPHLKNYYNHYTDRPSYRYAWLER